MIRGITRFLIIVADGIEPFRQANGVGHRHSRESGSDRPRAIQGFYGGDQRRGAFHQIFGRRIFGPVIGSEHRIGKRIVGIIHLIADAPKNDARMIAVAANEVRNVRDRPLRENFAVTEMAGQGGIPAGKPLVFRRRKFVKRFVHHEKTEAVAEIQKLRVRRIMTRANRVDADFLQQTQTPFEHFAGNGRANRSGVVMNANAFELGGNAVEKKSVVRVERRRANSKGRFCFVHYDFPGLRAAFQGVKGRGFERPQLRPRHFYFLDEGLNGMARR